MAVCIVQPTDFHLPTQQDEPSKRVVVSHEKSVSLERFFFLEDFSIRKLGRNVVGLWKHPDLGG